MTIEKGLLKFTLALSGFFALIGVEYLLHQYFRFGS